MTLTLYAPIRAPDGPLCPLAIAVWSNDITWLVRLALGWRVCEASGAFVMSNLPIPHGEHSVLVWRSVASHLGRARVGCAHDSVNLPNLSPRARPPFFKREELPC